jgi:hypothetical protein
VIVLSNFADPSYVGRHVLRDLLRPERVAQLCHPDMHNEFPPLRTSPTGVR